MSFPQRVTYEEIDDIHVPIPTCLNCKEPIRNMNNTPQEYCNDNCENEYHEVMHFILEGE